jgi:NhaA family Na+:H+ antiporter
MTNNLPETTIEKLTNPIQEFLHKEASGGILLIIATIIALIWANSPFADSYHHLWHTYLSINVGNLSLNYSLHHWINDGFSLLLD